MIIGLVDFNAKQLYIIVDSLNTQLIKSKTFTIMKPLNLFLLLIGAALIYTSCSKDELTTPEFSKNDSEILR